MLLLAFLLTSFFFGETQASCGGIIRVLNGSITSPEYPNLYPHNQLCTWELITFPKEKITFKFIDFAFEQCSGCTCDYVEVRSMLSSGGDTLHGKYCGTSVPSLITSVENRLKIIFKSDGSNSYRGFKANFTMSTLGIKSRNVDWLLNQMKRRKSVEMPRATLALFLAEPGFFAPQNTTVRELRDRITIRILARISRNMTISTEDLAVYVQALMVTCQNPRDFYGRDLVSELRARVGRPRTFTNPFVILALCNAGEAVTSQDVERVSEAFDSPRRPFWADIQAIATMAMQCLAKQVPVDERLIFDMQNELKKLQFKNGTVEGLVTTALVVQALRYNNSFENFFDISSAESSLMRAQEEDGSWRSSVRNSFYILPAISGKSLLDINDKHCPEIIENEEESLVGLEETIGDKFVVQYSVWIGSDVDLGRTWRVRVQSNKSISFYDVMETVSKLDNRHNVTYQVVEGKPYVRALFGKEDDPEMGVFWFTYVRSTSSKEPLTLVQYSPADVKVIPDQELILWYKSNDWRSNTP